MGEELQSEMIILNEKRPNKAGIGHITQMLLRHHHVKTVIVGQRDYLFSAYDIETSYNYHYFGNYHYSGLLLCGQAQRLSLS